MQHIKYYVIIEATENGQTMSFAETAAMAISRQSKGLCKHHKDEFVTRVAQRTSLQQNQLLKWSPVCRRCKDLYQKKK